VLVADLLIWTRDVGMGYCEKRRLGKNSRKMRVCVQSEAVTGTEGANERRDEERRSRTRQEETKRKRYFCRHACVCKGRKGKKKEAKREMVAQIYIVEQGRGVNIKAANRKRMDGYGWEDGRMWMGPDCR